MKARQKNEIESLNKKVSELLIKNNELNDKITALNIALHQKKLELKIIFGYADTYL